MGLGVLQQAKYGMRGQVRSNTGFQTEGRCRPLRSRLGSWNSYFSWFWWLPWFFVPSVLALTLQPLLLSNQCCDGSLLRGPQCHCWGNSSVRPICVLPCFRVLFDSPVYTWSQLLQGIWYTTPLPLSSGRRDFTLIRVRFRVRAEVKMEQMPWRARILSNFSLKPRT